MNGADERILHEAVAWHLASEQDDMDWENFTRWLEADSRHRDLYGQLALADAALQDHPSELGPVAEDSRDIAQRRWTVWIGGALAASLAAVLVVPQLAVSASQTYVSDEKARSIALQDGSQVLLAPRSRLTVDGREAENLALDGGALFTIHHDPNRTVSVRAGGLEIVDVGTRFEVETGGDALRVAVSEGEVDLRGEALGKAVRLPAGRRLLFDATHKIARVSAVAPAEVGEWREGRLTYEAAPLSLVAADLSRYAGVTVRVPAPLADRRFSGTLSIQNGETAVRDLAQLMALSLSRSGGAYSLAARD